MTSATTPAPPAPFWLSLFIVLAPIVAAVFAARWVRKLLGPEIGDDGALAVSLAVAAATGLVLGWVATRTLLRRGPGPTPAD